MYSYWEIREYFKKYDLVVIGSGIVGLSTALSFSEMNPRSRILVLEKGFLPDGASTKNAGFACFGSAGELLSDLAVNDNEGVWQTVAMRWNGLQLLRSRITDKKLKFKAKGGYELFYERAAYERCLSRISSLNAQVKQVLGLDDCYSDAPDIRASFSNCVGAIRNAHEGQLDTGRMMTALLGLARSKKITILNTVEVDSISDQGNSVEVHTNRGTFRSMKAVVATNGFAAALTGLDDVKPARAQVLITSRIKNLRVSGTFHFEEGYYYFRDVGDRVLFGGGRNLDFQNETTTAQELNTRIQDRLDQLLRDRILPGVPHKVAHRWSGIMGVGKEKKPILANISPNVLAAVRMGGMGVAIGSWVGREAAARLSGKALENDQPL